MRFPRILRIRKVLGTGAIETTSQGYRLAAPGDTVDAVRFVHLIERGHQLLTAGDPDRARHVLREALGLWRGRPLAEILDWEPGRFEAERLDEVRREAEEAVLDASLRAGRHAETAAQVREWCEQGIVNIVGGCCGTTPAHIAAIAEATRGYAPRTIAEPTRRTVLAGIEPMVLAA